MESTLKAGQGEDRLELLIDSISDYAIYMLDPTGHVVSWNRGAELNKGYSSEEILGAHFKTFYVPEDIAEAIPDLELTVALREGRFASEGWRLRKDGSRFWAGLTLTTVRDREGEWIGFAQVTRDLTERRRHEDQIMAMEASLRKERDRLRALSETSIDSHYIIESVRDANGEIEDFTFSYLSSNYREMVDLPEEKLLGARICEILPLNRTYGLFEFYKQVVLSGNSNVVEFQIKDENIKTTWLRVQAVKIGDGVGITASNISERKEKDLKLAEMSGQLRLLVEGARDYALFTIDAKGCVNHWNLGAERLLGYSEEEITGRDFSCLFTPEDIEKHVPDKYLNHARDSGRAEGEGWCMPRGGQQFWADAGITPIGGDKDATRGFIVILQNVTERWNIAVALEHARQEHAVLQEQFISHVSHELRTPLTAIHFFTTNVMEGLVGEVTPAQHEHLAFAVNNIQQMKAMVDDLIDVTRIDTNKLTVEARHTNLPKLVADVLGTCRTNAATKNISLSSGLPPSLPFVWADPARTRQILTNLIDNGIKFTPEGGSVTVRSESIATDENFVCLSVSDTGYGISPEDCTRIFERLSQLKNKVEASRNGLGLGLFIARELVTRQGGRIWVESKPKAGSTFFFTIPAFSMAKWCAPVLTAPNLETGWITLIAIDVIPVEKTLDADLLQDIEGVAGRCIHNATRPIFLPSFSNAGPVVETVFVVTCTDQSGAAAIASRCGKELRRLEKSAQFAHAIFPTTFAVEREGSKEKQIREIPGRIERLIQAHLSGAKLAPTEKHDIGNPAHA